MSEEMRNAPGPEMDAKADEANGDETARNAKAQTFNPGDLLKKIAHGKLALSQPIRAGGLDVTELEYDFNRLTGWEYAGAMDKDSAVTGITRISNKQALSLFAAAAGKATPGIDATDILERMGCDDAVKAVQLATVFFVTSQREGNKRISNA